jgi:methionine-rich copper-binding protein CopC
LFVRAGVAALLATIAGLVFVSVAFAHAEPATITPADGAVLTASPTKVVMTTTEEMDGSTNNALHVVNAAGTEVTTTAATVDSATHTSISVPLPANLPAGVYTIKWSTVSAGDGDSAEGTFTFTVAAQPTATASPTSTAPATPSASATVAPTLAPSAPGTGTGTGTGADGGSAMTWAWAGALAVWLSLNVAVVAAVRRGH